jgi:c-di-GMP-binding flagellar brake protein YcgR
VAIGGVASGQRSETLDISAGGVSFYLDSNVEVGTRIEFTIDFAAAALGAPRDVKVNCVGRVVRCSKEGQQHAIAAVIDEYHFERA